MFLQKKVRNFTCYQACRKKYQIYLYMIIFYMFM